MHVNEFKQPRTLKTLTTPTSSDTHSCFHLMDLLSTYALNLTRVRVFMFLLVKQYTSLPEIQFFFSMVKRDRVPWNYFHVSYEFIMLLVFRTKHQNILCRGGGRGGEVRFSPKIVTAVCMILFRAIY